MIPAALTDTPIFGFALTIFALVGFSLLFKNSKSLLLNPFLFSVAAIIALLLLGDIPYEHYEKGASILAFFMGPSIVALAIPLYKQLNTIKANTLPVIVGILSGVLVSILSGILLSKLLGLDREMLVSMAPKGASSAISMNLSQMSGGDPALTVSFVNIAGVVGYILGVKLLDLARIRHPAARGLAFGTASHVMGTKRALELGEQEGAMASLSIALAGVFTAFLMPLIVSLLRI